MKSTSILMKNVLKVCIFVLVILIFLSPLALNDVNQLPLLYTTGKYLGLLAAWSFVITQIPGIIRRLKIGGLPKKIGQIIQSSRAQWGIVMFLFAFLHYFLVQIAPFVLLELELDLELFKVFGLLALFLSFPLFLTSNLQSKKWLKKWWDRLHKLVYVIVWLIFAHVAIVYYNQFMRDDEIISLAGITALAIFATGFFQIVSLINSSLSKNQKA